MFLDTWFGDRTFEPRQHRRDEPATIRFEPHVYSGPPTPEVNPESRWVIGLAGPSAKPYAILHCACKVDTTWELPGNGTAPKPNCCKNAPAYPQDKEHTAHLHQTGIRPNGSKLGFEKAPAGRDPDPGSGPLDVKPALQSTIGENEQFIKRLVDADIAGAAADAIAIEEGKKPKK